MIFLDLLKTLNELKAEIYKAINYFKYENPDLHERPLGLCELFMRVKNGVFDFKYYLIKETLKKFMPKESYTHSGTKFYGGNYKFTCGGGWTYVEIFHLFRLMWIDQFINFIENELQENAE